MTDTEHGTQDLHPVLKGFPIAWQRLIIANARSYYFCDDCDYWELVDSRIHSLKSLVEAIAAPELLEALERVTECLNDPGVGDYEQWKRDCKEWTYKARAAIAKAKGDRL